MRDKTLIGWLVAGTLVVLLGFAARSEAALGCFREGSSSFATCSAAIDCAPVGGTDCTGMPANICYCPNGPAAPFCPCAPVQAPAMSHSTLAAAMLMVFAIGLFGMWRRMRGVSSDPS